MTRHKTRGDILLHKDRLFFSVVFHPLDIDLMPECSYFGPFLDWHAVDDEPSKQLPIMAFFCSSFFKHVDAGIWLIAVLSTCNWGFIDSWSHYVPLGVHGSGLTPSLPGSNTDVESIAFRRFQYFKSHAVCQKLAGEMCALGVASFNSLWKSHCQTEVTNFVFSISLSEQSALRPPPLHHHHQHSVLVMYTVVSSKRVFQSFFHAMICPNGVDSIGQYFW